MVGKWPALRLCFLIPISPQNRFANLKAGTRRSGQSTKFLLTMCILGATPLFKGRTLVILLAGGDKSTQAKDIKTALQLAKSL